MPRNLSEKLGAKCPPTTLDFSVARIFHLDDAFWVIHELEANPVESQHLQQKYKKRRKRKGEKKKLKTEKPKDVSNFLVSKF